MDHRIAAWLTESGLGANSLNSYMSRLRNLEAAYGDLDAAWEQDGLASILQELAYTSGDERAGRPNPSRVPINSHLYKQLASLRTALRSYANFRDSDGALPDEADIRENTIEAPAETPATAGFSLERDLERALRANISQLEPGLRITDGGVQRQVESGRIDILAEDGNGTPVVIELKAVRAPRDAVAQVLAYMGDILGENPTGVRGFLIAPDFDPKALAAAKMAPALELRSFSFNFTFGPAGQQG